MIENEKKRLPSIDNYLHGGTQIGNAEKVSRAKALLVKTPLNWKENVEWNFRVNSCDTLQQLATLCN